MRQLADWLGPAWTQLLTALFVMAVVGGLALMIEFGAETWVISAQLGLAWVFLCAVMLALTTHVAPKDRRRLWLTLGPGLGLLAVGVIWPRGVLFLAGIGVGWIVAAQFILRSRVRMEYQAAIKHLRRSAYDAAAAVMDGLIQAEPDDLNHRRFRAEIYRLAGRLDRAIADYEDIVARDPGSPVGLAGLAETYAQSGDFETALHYARQAHERDPRQWMGVYNLGMIEDRLGLAAGAIEHLEQALQLGVLHSRYRLLTHLWLARNYHRQGQPEQARTQLALLREQSAGLKDWQVIFESEQAAALRGLLAADVQLAEQIIQGENRLERLESTSGG